MVKRLLIFFLLIFTVGLSTVNLVNGQIVYTVDHEWAQLFINQDGTVDLTYNITLTVISGSVGGFYVGQPTRDFTIGQAIDQYGNTLQVNDASNGNDYRIDVLLNERLQAGNSIWFQVTTNVAGMIANDTTNEGNFRLIFPPQWTDVAVNDVRVQIVLPPNVNSNEIKFDAAYPWDNVLTVDGNLAVYWQIASIAPNEQVPLAVSFPSSSMPNYNPIQHNDGSDFEFFILLFGIGGFFLILIIIGYNQSKKNYTSPKISMETLGAKRGLTAVEAAYLLDLKPPQLVTAILYGLLQKRAIWTQETKPSLRLKVLPPYENKTGTKENPLRYYEIDFLQALKADGSLGEEKLAQTIMSLRDTIEQKIEGYNRKETVDYYRKIVDKAWMQVEAASTPELASNAYDEQLLWLMLDPNQKSRTETAFNQRLFQPNPTWLWWWYGYTVYHPNPIQRPNINTPTQTPIPTPIPGSDFANNIATSLEKTSNNIVVNIEKFANSILPPPPKTSHTPTRKGSDCVCACAACACACACVSCACACAGGGAH
jgi:hypothetical protein